ncbi:hypothetical protein ACIRBX_30190 [Kitasatospora sp. NPDC096147]|uniref:hypothetical protein n=1 Tax=Kitasatospora sp. NPDC096147 TaxID=3364093 RepID=UPI003829902E
MSRPGVVVTGLTVAALAAVGLLAFQANGAASRTPVAKPSVTAPASSAAPSPSASPTVTVPPLPSGSGTGRRVVYSAGSHWVWLVDPKKPTPLQAAFAVTPGTAEPAPGSYTVYSRSATATGTDGAQIEHVVRFAQQSGVVFGFSAAVDGASASPPADPKAKTGGIRSSRADSQSLWDFAPNGTKVVVIP